jgi:hypothetical protein
MPTRTETSTTSAIHNQMIQAEQHYQQALQKDEEFSILKGFRNIIKELKSKLERGLHVTKS